MTPADPNSRAPNGSPAPVGPPNPPAPLASLAEPARCFLAALADTVRHPLLILDTGLRVQSANRAFAQQFQVTEAEALNHVVYEVGDRAWDRIWLHRLLEDVLAGPGPIQDVEVEHDVPPLGWRSLRVTARRLEEPPAIFLAIEDATELQRCRETAQRLAAIVDSSEDAIIGLTLDGRVTTWNEAAEQLFGFPARQMLGQSVLPLVPDHRTQEIREVFERIQQKRRVGPLELHRTRKDGREADVSISVSGIKDAGGHVTGVVAIARDITERCRMEEAVRESEARLRAIVDNTAACIYLKNRDGRYLYMNPCALNTFDLDLPLVQGKTDYDIFPRELADEFVGIDRKVWATGAVQRFNDGGIGPNGQFHSFLTVKFLLYDRTGQADALCGISTDLTQWKQAEQALRESEARLRAILDTAADAIITIDERGTIEGLNRAAGRMFGYSAAELLGQNVKQLMPPSYRDLHDNFLARYLATGVAHIIGVGREVLGLRKDGTIFPLDLAVSEIREEGRRLFTGILRDLSERQMLQREILEIAAQEQGRLGQELHDTVAQELTGLLLMAESLRESLAQPAVPEVPLAARIVQGLKQTLGQVRALSRGLVSVEVEAEGLMTALRDLAARVQEQLGVACSFQCAEPVLIKDNVTATGLYRIAQEAVTNALKHSRAQHIQLRLARDGRRLTLQVRDDGVGIRDPRAEARGLGLRIMRYRAGLLHATLYIEPAEGGGTAITCTLPEGIPYEHSTESRAPGNESNPDRG